MLSVVVMKVVVLVTLLLSTFLFSMLPVKFVTVAHRQGMDQAKRRQFKSAISLLSCFAAGVFLATCLLDLLPQVRTNLHKALVTSHINTDYPMTEFIVIFGLFLILFIEQLVLVFKESGEERRPLLPKQNSAAQNHSDYDEISGLSSDEHIQDSMEENYTTEDETVHPKIRSLILLLALSLHSLFEGLAVGLQETSKSVLEIFLALALHKLILAFSLGLNLMQSQLSLSSIVKSNLLFSATSPIGIGIGAIVMYKNPDRNSANFVDGVLEGIACGTFLYVVFIEILPHEFVVRKRYPARMLKVLFLVLGYATISVILLWNKGD